MTYTLLPRRLPATCGRWLRRPADAPLSPCRRSATHELIDTDTGQVWPLCCSCAAASASHHGLPFPAVSNP